MYKHFSKVWLVFIDKNVAYQLAKKDSWWIKEPVVNSTRELTEGVICHSVLKCCLSIVVASHESRHEVRLLEFIKAPDREKGPVAYLAYMLSGFNLISHLRFISITFHKLVEARFECVCSWRFDNLCTNCSNKNSPEIAYVRKVETFRLISCAVSVYYNRIIDKRDSYWAKNSYSEV